MILVLLIIMIQLYWAQPVTPALQRRLERVQQLSDVPTARVILRLLARDPTQSEPQVVKRLQKFVNDWQHQVISMTAQFLETPVTDATSTSLVDVVLFLAQDDATLFQIYMTPREQTRLSKSIKRYHSLFWPENKAILEDCIQLMRAAKTLRDMIVRMHQLSEQPVSTSTIMVTGTREMVRVALTRMKLLCKKRTGAPPDNALIFEEEVDEYLLTLDALLVDRQEQRDQLAIVLALWQNLCINS